MSPPALKAPTRPGQDDCGSLFVVVKACPHRTHRVVQGTVERIQMLGPVHGDDPEIALTGDEQFGG